MHPRRFHRGRMRDRFGVGIRRGLERVRHRLPREADKLFRRLEFLILRAKPFQLQTERAAGD